MPRRIPIVEEESNKERWLVSYADFITLLFAFFVVMYSISSVNEGKYKVLSETLHGVFNAPQRSLQPIAVGENASSATGSPNVIIEPINAKATEASDGAKTDAEEKGDKEGGPGVRGERALREIADRVSEDLSSLLDQNLLNITEARDWVEISLRDKILFRSGDAIPSDESYPVLEDLATILRDYNNAVVVEGFTDNFPIRTSAYPTNWELSAARAAAVVRALSFSGVNPERLAAVGYGEHQPIARNDTAEGRSRNRRVVLVVSKDERVRYTLR